MTMASGSWPILSVEEAIHCSKQLLDFTISEDELRNPTFQFVKRFYLEVLTRTLNTSVEQLTQPHFNLLGQFQHPELAEDAASTIFFTLLVQRFMHACLVKDFTKADILDPKPKRTLKCVSAVINFVMFKRSQDHLFENAIAEKVNVGDGLLTLNRVLGVLEDRANDAIIEQKKQLLINNKELRRKISQIKATRAKDEDKIQQILPEVDNLEKVVYDLNKQQAAVKQEISQRKTEIAELTSKEAEIKVTIASDKEDCEKLKVQIVTSPDKFREEINRLNNAMHSCKTSITEKSKKLQDYQNHVESINLLEENAGQAVKLITSVEEEIEKLRMLQNKVQDLQDIATNDDEVLRELTAKHQNVKRHLASTNEKLTRLGTKSDKKVSATAFSIKQAEQDQDIWRKRVNEDQAAVLATDVECQEILKSLEDKENSHANSMEDMKNAYQQLLSQLNQYHASLEKGCEKLSKSLSDD